jgi:hypothetical protein
MHDQEPRKNPEQATSGISRINDQRLANTMFGRIDIELMTGKQPENPNNN